MAKYKGLLEISGAIGDLVFYNLNGTPVVRRKSGFSKQDYQNNPNYQKVRENSSEFGHCSKVGKMIREAVNIYIENHGDQYLYQKFAKLMTQIKDLDITQKKGKRTVENGLKHHDAYKLLTDFQFGQFAKHQSILSEQSIFSKKIVTTKKQDIDSLHLITIYPNFQDFEVSVMEQQISVDNLPSSYEFDLHFQDATSPLLYLLITKKNKKVVSLGFVS